MRRFTALACALLCAVTVQAKITLPSLLGDGMVLQRNTTVQLWGHATGTSVKVVTSWDKCKYQVRPDASGNWCVQVTTPDAGGPYEISFNDGTELKLRDILIGEVARNNADTPQEDCRGEWKSSTPGAIRSFSATAYHFGKTLSSFMPGLPVGLIATDWGGTPIEAWLSVGALEAIEGIDLPRAKGNRWEEVRTGQLFNGMIYPLRRFAARGFIWYQGEANLWNAPDYAAITAAMVGEWRTLWGNADMPYYLVQIAPYSYGNPEGRMLPLLVEQQYRIPALLPHSGVAATTDIGHRDCIHPPYKKEVGERLAWLALARDYGVEGLPVTPTYKSMTVEEGTLRLTFDGVSREGNCFRVFGPQKLLEIKGFELAGEDRVWYPATARIDWNSNDILLSCPEVPQPVAARYAFRNWPEGANVLTDAGLPLPMFRTDNWPVQD